MTIRTKRVTLLLLAFFSSTFISLAPLSTYTAQAASETPSEQLEKWLYYRGMRACLNNPDFDNIVPANDNGNRTSDEINKGHWLPGSGADQPNRGFGYLAPDMDDGDDGTVSCEDGSIFVRGATAFGFTNPVQLLCAINRALDATGDGGRITPSHPTDCEQSEKFEFDGGGGDVFQRALTKALSDEGSKDRPSFNINDNNGPDYSYKALLYLIGKNSLEIFCGNGASLESGSANGGDINSKEIVSVDIVKADGSIDQSKPYALADGDRDENSKVDDIYYNQGGDANNAKDLECWEMAAMTRDNSVEFAKWVKQHPELYEQTETAEPGNGEDAPICTAGALGWVLCPLSEAMVGAIEGIADLLESFLVFQPLTTSEQGKAIKIIWGSLLGIANAGLILAFLVIVFSQATSVGLNNYGIKKLLPRVIAAAILMNLSFYLCAIAVDISNILGVSIKGIVQTGLDAVAAGGTNPDLQPDASMGQWIGTLSVGLLAAAILVGTGAIFLLIPVLISGLMAVLTAFLILAARQVIITLLIIVAPLAILAWILPNTESWFTKWRKLFTTLLLLYPMVMAIFYGAILVSSVILASAGDSGNAINNWTVQILAFLVLVVPLFSLPFVMKAAGGVMDRLGVLVNNRNKGLVDRSRKKSRELYDRGGYARGKGIRTQAKTELRNKRFAGRLDRAYGGTGNWRDNLTRAQAGGAAEVAKMAGETKVAQKAKSGVSGAANKGVAGLYGVSPAAGDLGAQVVAGTVNAANRLPGREMRDAQRAALQRATRGVVASATSKAVEDEILRLEELPVAATPDTFEQYGRTPEAQNDVTQRAISEMLSTRYGGQGVNKVASMLKDRTYMSGAGAEGFTNGARKNASTYAAAHPDVGYALNDAQFVSKSMETGGNPDVVGFDWNAKIAGDSGKVIKLKTAEQAANIASAPNFTVEVAERAYNSPAYGDASPPIQEVIAAKLRAAGKIT